MKSLSDAKLSLGVIPGVIALGVGAVMVASPPPIAAAAETGFLGKVHKWQDKMSDKFRDTWKNLRNEGKPSVVSASVDLREQEKSYMLRLDLPGRDLEKVEINLKGDTLHIVVPEVDTLARYEQTVVLAGADMGAAPVIERKKDDGVITVTVPKGANPPGPVRVPYAPDATWVAPSPWERDVLSQMEDLRRGMNQIFEEAFREVPRAPELEKYFDQPRFGSFIDLKEEETNYVVTAYLPERDVKNVNASIQGKVLKIEALAEDTPTDTDKEGKSSVTRRAYYSQQLTLPGEVEADKLAVEKKEGLLKITVPKSK